LLQQLARPASRSDPASPPTTSRHCHPPLPPIHPLTLWASTPSCIYLHSTYIRGDLPDILCASDHSSSQFDGTILDLVSPPTLAVKSSTECQYNAENSSFPLSHCRIELGYRHHIQITRACPKYQRYTRSRVSQRAVLRAASAPGYTSEHIDYPFSFWIKYTSAAYLAPLHRSGPNLLPLPRLVQHRDNCILSRHIRPDSTTFWPLDRQLWYK
jgi:hypothetical protein